MVKPVKNKRKMGQGDVINILKKERRRMTTKEIADKCKVGISCTHVKLKKLRELGEVEMTKKGTKYFFKLKND